MIRLFWDASDIWGPLAAWALRGLDVPFRVTRAAEIADGIPNRDGTTLLLVPGGFSRHKGALLGEKGREAIRRFVAEGGSYLGFCGGAGLALTGENSLALCPWRRAGYENRIQHYMSGHFYVEMTQNPADQNRDLPAAFPPWAAFPAAGKNTSAPPVPDPEATMDAVGRFLPPSPLLPVWWPGRFAPEEGGEVTVLARYDAPGPDFWLADLPVADLPPSVFADWEKTYGFSLSPSFLRGEPCVIRGRHGKGRYVLAYSHLETPESPDANIWFVHLLAGLGGCKPALSLVPSWNLDTLTPAWECPDLLRLWKTFATALDAGKAAGLFFSRSSWLMGWRTNLPGAACNTVRALLHTVLSLSPGQGAQTFWERERRAFVPAFTDFAERATRYLLAERLAMTLSRDLPKNLEPEKLLAERTAIFGAPGMAGHAGGLLGSLLPILDELAFLQIRENAGDSSKSF